MTNLKVRELILALKPHEIKAMKLYLQSPIYNYNTQLSALFDLLISEESISKVDIYKKVVGNSNYDDKRLRYLFSELCGHLERYLTLLEFEKDERGYSVYKQKILSERSIHKAFSYESQKNKTGGFNENAAFYLSAYRSKEISLQYESKYQSRLSNLKYGELLLSLDQFYFLRKIQLQCELINLKNVLNKEFTVILIDPICEFVVSNAFLNSPLIEAYYSVLISLKGNSKDSQDAFEKIIEVASKQSGAFSLDDLNNIYQYAKNFCIRRINKGEDQYRRILFDLYKNILANKRLMQRDYFSPWEFKNIVTLGLRLNEGEWIKKFIPAFINHLPPHERENALTYNTAMLYYYKKQYNFVLKYLQAVDFTDLYYQLDSKSILLKVYFEIDEQEALLHHISAFKIFLKRNKNISTYQYSIYKNFIKYSLKIFRAGHNSRKLEALNKEILSSTEISDRNWLIERIREAH